MKPQQLFIRLSALAVMSMWSLVSVPLAGQAPGAGSGIPRTPWGDPDLQGDWSAGYLLMDIEHDDLHLVEAGEEQNRDRVRIEGAVGKRRQVPIRPLGPDPAFGMNRRRQ